MKQEGCEYHKLSAFGQLEEDLLTLAWREAAAREAMAV